LQQAKLACRQCPPEAAFSASSGADAGSGWGMGRSWRVLLYPGFFRQPLHCALLDGWGVLALQQAKLACRRCPRRQPSLRDTDEIRPWPLIHDNLVSRSAKPKSRCRDTRVGGRWS